MELSDALKALLRGAPAAGDDPEARREAARRLLADLSRVTDPRLDPPTHVIVLSEAAAAVLDPANGPGQWALLLDLAAALDRHLAELGATARETTAAST